MPATLLVPHPAPNGAVLESVAGKGVLTRELITIIHLDSNSAADLYEAEGALSSFLATYGYRPVEQRYQFAGTITLKQKYRQQITIERRYDPDGNPLKDIVTAFSESEENIEIALPKTPEASPSPMAIKIRAKRVGSLKRIRRILTKAAMIMLLGQITLEAYEHYAKAREAWEKTHTTEVLQHPKIERPKSGVVITKISDPLIDAQLRNGEVNKITAKRVVSAIQKSYIDPRIA